MKNLNSLVIVLILSFIFACNSLTDEAINYNDAIISKQQTIVNLFNSLDSSFSDTIHKTFVTHYEKLKTEIEQQLNTIDTAIKPFNGSDDFKNAYKELLKSYNEVVNNEYKQLVDWYSLPDSLFTEDVLAEFRKTYQLANEKLEQALNRFREFQKQFASTYKFNLIE